jgi:hypothetical protein
MSAAIAVKGDTANFSKDTSAGFNIKEAQIEVIYIDFLAVIL